MIEINNTEVIVTNAHVASVVSAFQHDIGGLMPEVVGVHNIELAAMILALMDELDKNSSHGVSIMLALMHDNMETYVRPWAMLTYDLVDGEELREARRQIERVKYGLLAQRKTADDWKRQVGVLPSV